MKLLYPAQKLKIFSIKYLGLSLICLFSFLFSFSQKSIFAEASVDLASFTAQSNGADKIVLNIVTSAEMNLSHFVIQRSTKGLNFEDVAILFTEEDNTKTIPRYYSYANHVDSNSEAVYYRLKIVNAKADYKYSDTISLTPSMTSIYARVSSQENLLRITNPKNWTGKTVKYNIYKAGESIIKQEVRINASQTETLNIADLPAGKYIIKAVNGKDSSEQKIVKLSRYS